MKSHSLLSILTAFGLTHCAEKTGFQSESKQRSASGSSADQFTGREDVLEQPVDVTITKVPLIAKTLRVKYGQPNPKVDYLFIVDNSVSMSAIVDKVKAGFSSISSEPGVFSPDSHVAVMSTMIGSTENLAVTGLDVTRYTGIDSEPGFLDFVNRSAIVKYRAEVPNQAAKWTFDGCEQKWFLPDDKDVSGKNCFEAAIQSTYAPVGAEAGIHAFKQLLVKNNGKPVFRDDALVNVIFVSDTHDPGIQNQVLIDTRPTFAELKTLIQKDNKSSNLKFHALAPEASCSTEAVYDKAYYQMAQVSGGEKGDSCILSDYRDFLRKMIAKSQITEPNFRFDKPVSFVKTVIVNGTEHSDYSLSETKDSIVLRGLNPFKPVEVTIEYLD